MKKLLFGNMDWPKEFFETAVILLWCAPIILWRSLFEHIVLFDKILYQAVMTLIYVYMMFGMKMFMEQYWSQKNLFWMAVLGMTPAAVLQSLRWLSEGSVVVVLAMAAALFYAVVMFGQMVSGGGKKDRRARRWKLGMMRIFGCACLMAVLGGGVGGIVSGIASKIVAQGTESLVPDVVETEGDSADLWRANVNYLRMWQKERYENLNERGKMELYQKLLDMECQYLGIEPVTVEKVSYSSATQRGSYVEYGRVISISDELLSADREEVLEALLHECHHAYAHDLVTYVETDEKAQASKLRMYQDVKQLKEGFETYADAAEDYAAYYMNPVEVAARKYSLERTGEYLEVIDAIV